LPLVVFGALRATGRSSAGVDLGGGPNGAAVGPDGNIYVANDGGLSFAKTNGIYSITGVPASYVSGSIQRVNLKSGVVDMLYDRVDGQLLKGPNDILFADDTGFWFTDTGKIHDGVQEKGGLYWAAIDGTDIRRIVYPLASTNGIALSPDRKTIYVALSNGRQIAAYTISAPGMLSDTTGHILATIPGQFILDNIAVEQSGNLVIATVIKGGLVTISPNGRLLDFMRLPDMAVTAVAFGGAGMKALFATLSTTGKIVAIPWPRPGLPSLFGHRALG
jgi:gluconolactonase